MPSKPYWAGAAVTAPSGSAALGALQSPTQLAARRDGAGLGERCDTAEPTAPQEIPAKSTGRVPSAAGTCPVPAWGLEFVPGAVTPQGGARGSQLGAPTPLTRCGGGSGLRSAYLPVPVGCMCWEHWFCPHFCCWLSPGGCLSPCSVGPGQHPIAFIPPFPPLPPSLLPREGVVLMVAGFCPTAAARGAGAGGLGSCPQCPQLLAEQGGC